MLPPPAAHRRVALSVDLDTLPTRVAYYRHMLDPGHHLIVAREGITYGALEQAYIRTLPPWARRRIFAAVGVTDPVDDPSTYHRMRWWDSEWPVGATAVHLIEDAVPGLITPWPHAWMRLPA